MPNVAIYNQTGNKVGTMELSENIFGQEVNVAAMHSYVKAYLANQRQGTQSAKTRAEVSGGGKKPWRQKGSGRARQGSTRSPQWYHGGIAHGPKPREYGFSINKKVKRLAMKSALSSKVADDEILVLDTFAQEEIKTAAIAKVLAALQTGKKTLIVLPEKDDVIYKSARNIAGVKVALVNTLNVYDILNCDKMLVLQDAVAKIEEVYA